MWLRSVFGSYLPLKEETFLLFKLMGTRCVWTGENVSHWGTESARYLGMSLILKMRLVLLTAIGLIMLKVRHVLKYLVQSGAKKRIVSFSHSLYGTGRWSPQLPKEGLKSIADYEEHLPEHLKRAVTVPVLKNGQCAVPSMRWIHLPPTIFKKVRADSSLIPAGSLYFLNSRTSIMASSCTGVQMGKGSLCPLPPLLIGTRDDPRTIWP